MDYKTKKIKNQVLQEFIKNKVSEKNLNRIHECGSFLLFHTDERKEKKRLVHSNSCKNRFCAMCAYKNARKDAMKISIMLKYLENNCQFLFLTLTSPNVTSDNLADEITDYNKAFKWQEKAAIQGNRFLGFDINCFNRDLETLNLNEKMTTDEDSYSQCMLGVKLYLDYDKRKEAVKWFEESAIQGNIFAQSILGELYYAGYEVNKNYHEAVKWYEKAAIQGYYVAQYELGNMYYFGRGVNQDYNEAIKWYEKSALQGNVNAQNDLGYMYKAGKGVNQDYKEAFKWYEKAAIQGNSKAKLEIGEMYQFGQGLNKDYKEAFKLYKEASTQGNEGKYKLRELDYYGWSIN